MVDSTNKKNNFFEMVYDVVKLIPSGKVTSYGAIAEYLGSKKSSRMVGWAMNNSHFQNEFIPAHRVVNRHGLLTGKRHFGGENMSDLLKNEGIKIENDQIIDFDNCFWDPNKFLKI
ncbi:MAG: MGMT family protein [Bacteroidota bacterium]|nr:MGMT family protein [Bacteroidota bacterium]